MPIDDLERVLEELESATNDRSEAARVLTPLLEVHQEALRRMLEILEKRGQKAVIDEFLADSLVGSLLRGYGLGTLRGPGRQSSLWNNSPRPAKRPLGPFQCSTSSSCVTETSLKFSSLTKNCCCATLRAGPLPLRTGALNQVARSANLSSANSPSRVRVTTRFTTCARAATLPTMGPNWRSCRSR